jgi:hypothetical protein
MIVTIRGTPVRLGLKSETIGDLPPLRLDAARDAFLASRVRSLRAIRWLEPLLVSTLEGHALSIRLVAAQAIGLPSLAGLQERWDEGRAAILRQGTRETRLTSVRASLALSLKSPRIVAQPLARRLVSILGHLPAGLAETDVKNLLGDRGRVPKGKAIEAVDCLRQLRLVESRVTGAFAC